MNYFSTRDTERKNPLSSAMVIKKGIADDGGLYMPESIPEISMEDIKALCSFSYPERAAKILSLFLTDYTYDELYKASETAYSEKRFPGGAAPISFLGNTHRILELWHGPTCAFKDMALQIMPILLSLALKKTGENKTAFILVATSGDTGKAALEGYADVENVKIMVFYPEDGVSDMQKLQMTSQKGNNVCVCAIKGNFDDAQTGVKKIFSDAEIAKKLSDASYFLSSANSINWGRLAPQIVYYISAYCDLVASKDISLGEMIDVSVPTGNFGNIFAAFLAKEMGLPIRKLICASNKNNILTDFLNTGIYDRNRSFYTTMSPSMDILISSNLERLLYTAAGAEKCREYMKRLSETGRYQVDDIIMQKLSESFEAQFCDEDMTARTIRNIFETYSYLIDPHTAVAVYASMASAAKNRNEAENVKILTASTASPYKFAYDVLYSLGEKTDSPLFEALAKLQNITGTEIPSPLKALCDAEIRFTSCAGKSKEELWQAAEKFLKA